MDTAALDTALDRPLAVILAGIDDSACLRAALSEPALATLGLIRLEPGCVPPCPAKLWRFETTWGAPLDGQAVLRGAWHRPPYALTLRLVQYAPGTTQPTVLDEATLGTRQGWTDLLDTANRLAARMVTDAAGGCSRGPASTAPAPRPAPGGPPGWLRDQMHRWKLRLMDEWWSLGVSDATPPDVLTDGRLGRVTWFQPKPAAAYLADPFPWPGSDRILCEEMPRDGRPGRIVAVSESGGGLAGRSVILDDGAHHSYPCTLALDGRVYCVPESTERGATRIYELHQAGWLEPVCGVAPGRRLADPTLFRHGGRLWLACTDLDVGAADNLCLLHAPAVTGPWIEHALWPVRIDVRGARPAGAPFRLDGSLIRPGQDCAATYGAAVALHEVVHLAPDAFQERLITVLRPDPAGPFPDGLHTLVHDGHRFWLDGKRFILDPRTLRQKAMRRVRASFGLRAR